MADDLKDIIAKQRVLSSQVNDIKAALNNHVNKPINIPAWVSVGLTILTFWAGSFIYLVNVMDRSDARLQKELTHVIDRNTDYLERRARLLAQRVERLEEKQ